MRNRAMALLGIAVFAALAGGGPRSWADGAVAVGSTGDVVRDGIAFGMVINERKGKAAAIAVRRCRTFQARAAAELCKVVATFSGKCFAVAYDPKPGTPGAGWGIGPDQMAANRRAIAMCEETAGPTRRGYCRVESGGCDTSVPSKRYGQRPSDFNNARPSLLPPWDGARPAMPTRYPEKDLQPKEIFAAVAPSVYLLLAGRSSGALLQGDGVLGSAVAISADSALTNCHVVQHHSFIRLVDERSKQTFVATVARAHRPTDRCFLRVEGKLRAISGVRTIASLAIGERVYTIGNPSGLTKTLGEGLISGLRVHKGITHVQTSAPMSKGSSGGALVDSKGVLVGITTFLLKDSQNLNFAIAAEEYWR